MAVVQSDKVNRFKTKIGFDAAINADQETRFVACEWPSMLKAPLKKGKWVISTDSLWRAPGGAAREWNLSLDAQVISIRIFVGAKESQPARECFLQTASETMTMEVPYVKGPAGLGTISVTSPTPKPNSFIWLYRNVCFQLTSYETDQDLLPIAKWLQSKAEARLVNQVENEIPTPTSILVDKPALAVGATARVELKMIRRTEYYRLFLDYDRIRVKIPLLQELHFRVVGTKAGPAKVTGCLVDRLTLLSAEYVIDLNFT